MVDNDGKQIVYIILGLIRQVKTSNNQQEMSIGRLLKKKKYYKKKYHQKTILTKKYIIALMSKQHDVSCPSSTMLCTKLIFFCCATFTLHTVKLEKKIIGCK